MSNEFWEEVFKLVSEYDAQRTKITIEHRLYYNKDDGTITGYHEIDHPEDLDYIVLENPDLYFKNNTNLLRVKEGKLLVLDPKQPSKARLQKSSTGYKTVQGHAALLLEDSDDYKNIQYYDQTNS
jgi:hypothetical protein